MDRRHFLRAVPLGLVTSSIGCIGPTPGESTSNGAENDDTLTTSTTDGSDPTPDPDDPVQIVFVDDAERTVTIRLARSDQTILNVTETISSDYRAFDSGITSTGTYELSVTFQDGPESTGTYTSSRTTSGWDRTSSSECVTDRSSFRWRSKSQSRGRNPRYTHPGNSSPWMWTESTQSGRSSSDCVKCDRESM